MKRTSPDPGPAGGAGTASRDTGAVAQGCSGAGAHTAPDSHAHTAPDAQAQTVRLQLTVWEQPL